MRLLGTIRELHRYPIKSMAGEARTSAEVGFHGFSGDRRFALRRIGDTSGFPWLSASRLPALVLHRASLEGDGLRVITPDGQVLAADGAELRVRIEAALGAPVELTHLRQGIFDESPVSLITLATLRRVSEAGGVASDVRRFRPNVVIETGEAEPFEEDRWVGLRLRCGEVELAVTQRDRRCAMMNLDPQTAASNPRVLKASAELNDAFAGVYAVPLRQGALSVGDALYAT